MSSSSSCTTSSRTVGRWGSSPANSPPTTAPSGRDSRRVCRNCRSSTWTSPAGSGAGCPDPSGTQPSRNLLGGGGARAVDAFRRQDLPVERLISELQPERDLAQNPVFQVIFALQNTPGEALRLPELSLKPVELEVTTTRF